MVSWRRKLRFNILKFLRLKDMPGRVALGFALGACVNFYPTFGFGVPLAIFIAGLVRGNLAASFLGDVIFKPLFPIMFYFDLVTGSKLIGQGITHIRYVMHGLLKLDWKIYQLVGKAFFLGALLNTLILGTILYIAVYEIFSRYHRQMTRLFLAQKLI